MAELLIELLSEEIPARMQAGAAADLERLVGEKLGAAGLAFARAAAFATPRRLALLVEGLPARQPDRTEERKGPRVGAPEAAIQGFLKSAGLASLAACEQRDTGKGVFWFANLRQAGRPAGELVAELLQEAIAQFPWPKSMRWGRQKLRWVRPLQGLLVLLDGEPVPLRLALGPEENVAAGRTTVGHRFLGPGPIAVTGFADYRAKLREAFVMLDPAERRAAILEQAAALAGREGLALRPDEALLEEIVGLVEWPVALMGRIDDAFMTLPPELLATVMRRHQKYLALLDGEGRLAPRFILVANIAAKDGGRAIVAGNERVLRARLADARFFWDQDRRVRLADRVPALRAMVFHARLGTLADKTERLRALAPALAQYWPQSYKKDTGGTGRESLIERAALLSKADLTSGMVGEFPELQGIMGRYYALHDGEPAAVAAAIAEHYAPLGPGDRCPTAPVSVALALADKIDTLAGFFAIGERPTGSKDPYALRRAALGVIRLILENNLRLPLAAAFARALELHRLALAPEGRAEAVAALLAFIADRLKVALREKGVRHDLIAAVFALGGEDDLVRLLARVEALGRFLESEAGANLLVAYRRASNIVRIEEKKDRQRYNGGADPALLRQREEQALDRALAEAARASAAALAAEDFAGAMAALAALRQPVDAFFDEVTVNCEEAALRANRLRLLSQIRATLYGVADFARIEG